MNFSTPKSQNIEDFLTVDNLAIPNLLNSIVVPRPIAFITSKGRDGTVNAAPFSYFNIVCTNPPIVSIAIQRRDGRRKDTSQNIIDLKEFVINICSLEMAKAVSISGGDFPPDVSEIELANLELLSSDKISVPRVANTFAQMECMLNQVIEVGKDPADLILGEVIQVHLHKSILNTKGLVDVEKLNPLARLAGITFAKVSSYCEIPRGL